MNAVLSSKGEIVIPADLLDRYGLNPGATVDLEPREGEIALRLSGEPRSGARVLRHGGDVLLEAPAGAPPMTPEYVKRFLNDDVEGIASPQTNSKDTTDAHLVTLAKRHALKLATLDSALLSQPWAAGVADNPLFSPRPETSTAG